MRLAGNWQGRICKIAIPTCNRRDVLERAVRSYLSNAIRHGRVIELFVSDDCPDREARNRCRSLLHHLSREYDSAIWYAGYEEKLIFARKLIEHSKLSSQPVKQALFDSDKTGLPTFGANRNAILLHCLGELVVTVDDDTVCEISSQGDTSAELLFVREQRFSSSHPCHVRVYPDRAALLKAINNVNEDFLAIHEKLLGRQLGQLFCKGNGLHALTQAGVSTCASDRARIGITFNGMAGDCAVPSPTNYLLFTGDSFKELIASEEGYRAASLSREILRAVNQTTVSNVVTNMPGLFTGLDLRYLMPPFFPVGRGEDIIFWNSVSRCVSDAWFGFLPWSLCHLPKEARFFRREQIARTGSSVALDVLVSALIRSAPPAEGETITGLQALGRKFQAFGSLNDSQYDELVVATLAREIESFLMHLREKLQGYTPAASYWHQDLELYVAVIRASLSESAPSIPIDILYGRSVAEARAVTRRSLSSFGELLLGWADIVTTALALKQTGVVLGCKL